jgi:hypothetical protein
VVRRKEDKYRRALVRAVRQFQPVFEETSAWVRRRSLATLALVPPAVVLTLGVAVAVALLVVPLEVSWVVVLGFAFLALAGGLSACVVLLFRAFLNYCIRELGNRLPVEGALGAVSLSVYNEIVQERVHWQEAFRRVGTSLGALEGGVSG